MASKCVLKEWQNNNNNNNETCGDPWVKIKKTTQLRYFQNSIN